MQHGRFVAGAGALMAAGLVIAPAVASAHSATATATCDGLFVDVDLYPEGVVTTVTIDGVPTTRDGEGQWLVSWDPTQAHTWSVFVDGADGFDERRNGESTPCDVPPEETTTTTAPPVETTTTLPAETSTTLPLETSTTAPDTSGPTTTAAPSTTAPGTGTTTPDGGGPTTTADAGPTTTAPEATTTAPAAPSTTVVAEVTLPAQVATTTSTTVRASSGGGGVGDGSSGGSAQGRALPSTGSSSTPFIGIGAIAVLTGLALLTTARRRSAG